MDGVLVIDKPRGPTSHDVVARMRRILGERRIGHTGTLDPLATGVLPLAIGRATRLARFMSAGEKGYDAVITLGVTTDTCDGEGRVIDRVSPPAWPSLVEVERALDAFRGTFLQQPPAFSAKKIGGRRSYALARDGTPADLPAPVSVTTHAVIVHALEGDRLALGLSCSAGFYVRSLAHDLGVLLGVGAHLSELRRTRSGDYTLADALPLDSAERDPEAAAAAVIPLSRVLPGLVRLVLTDEGVKRAAHGRDLGPADFEAGGRAAAPRLTSGHARLVDHRGELVGIAEPARVAGLLHPLVILV